MKFLFLSFCVFSLASCYLNLSGSGYAQFYSEDVGYDLDSDSQYFYVDLNISVYESRGEEAPVYDINTTELVGDSDSRNSPSNCEIEYIPTDEDQTASEKSETKVCIMDVPEANFKLKPLALYLNIPEDMCNFVQWSLPWYFNQKILAGPKVATCEGRGETPTQYFCNLNETGSCPPDPGSLVEKNECDTEEENLCTSMVDKGEDEKVRCCFGGRKSDGKTKWNPDPACFIGPALVSEEISPQAFYVTQHQDLTNARGNVRIPVTLKALTDIDKSQASNIHHANYLKDLDKPLEELKKLKMDRSNNGLAEEYKFYNKEAYNKDPQPFFRFACLDSAQEVVHEILLMVREWNTLEDFMEFYYSGDEDSGEGPDLTGDEGEDCKYEERLSFLPGASGKCNDFCDLDDYANNNIEDGCATEEGYPVETLETSETEGSN